MNVLASKDATTEFTVQRGMDTLSYSFNTLFDARQGLVQKLMGKEPKQRRRLGFWIEDESSVYDYQKQEYSFLASIPKGSGMAYEFLTDQLKAFGQMFKGNIKVNESLGSFITIGKMFGPEWEWRRFWYMTASLSILLGFLNLLPIPACPTVCTGASPSRLL